MQILQWLFKIAEQEPPRTASNSTTINKKECTDLEEKKIAAKDFVILITNHGGGRKHVPKSRVSCENLILLRYLYQTLNLKGLGNFKGCQNPLQKNKNKNKKKNTSENKVLPIAGLSQSWSRNESNQLNTGSDKTKKKKKAVSRMKELLKWAATAKVLNSKKGGAGSKQLAAVDDDDGLVCDDESPKISVRLDMEDYTAYYTLRDDEIHAAGIGNWITTDSEFVVLEL